MLADNLTSPIFNVVLPLQFYGQIRECDVDVVGVVSLEGEGSQGDKSALNLYGAIRIVCERLDVTADVITLDGKLWLEADEVSSPPRMELFMKNGAQVALAGKIAETYPWSGYASGFPPPTPEDELARLINECARRLPDGGVLTLLADYKVPEDLRMRWVPRRFAAAFPELIRLMIQHGFASAETFAAGGEKKVRIRFKVSWNDLQQATVNPSQAGNLGVFVNDARGIFGA